MEKVLQYPWILPRPLTLHGPPRRPHSSTSVLHVNQQKGSHTPCLMSWLLQDDHRMHHCQHFLVCGTIN
jgi:hypothetical protein